MDLGFYDSHTAQLQKEGFHRIADIEDLTMSRIHPEMRTFMRCLSDDTGTIQAGMFYVKPKGFKYFVARLRKANLERKVLNFSTEFSNGFFVETSNAPKSLSAPAQFLRESLSELEPLPMLSLHRERVKKYLEQYPEATPLSVKNYGELIARQNRITALVAAHRAAVGGGLLKEEMERIAGRKFARQGQELWAEMELRRSKKG